MDIYSSSISSAAQHPTVLYQNDRIGQKAKRGCWSRQVGRLCWKYQGVGSPYACRDRPDRSIPLLEIDTDRRLTSCIRHKSEQITNHTFLVCLTAIPNDPGGDHPYWKLTNSIEISSDAEFVFDHSMHPGGQHMSGWKLLNSRWRKDDENSLAFFVASISCKVGNFFLFEIGCLLLLSVYSSVPDNPAAFSSRMKSCFRMLETCKTFMVKFRS